MSKNTNTDTKAKRALISVYYKEGIESIAKQLTENGWEILSTGGTTKYLKKRHIPVTEVSEVTKFPEILNGRVKTIHPLLFGPILAKKTPQHLAQLEKFSAPKIDLVIVNFYPFEEALPQKKKGIDFMVDYIDIGGPSVVRAAAKNFEHTIVIVEKEDYIPIVEKIVKDGDIDIDERRALAAKAFSYTSFYDSLIAGCFLNGMEGNPAYMNAAGRKAMDLRYGENPHQRGALYIRDKNSPLMNFKKLQGKELSFNNILDFSMVMEVLNLFTSGDEDFSVIVKHQNPCGAAVGTSQKEAFKKAFDGDPKSAFGGIVGFNQPLGKEAAEEMKKIFFEVIVAPDYTNEALQVFKKKKNLRIIKMPLGYQEKSDIKTIPGGFVLQEKDNQLKAFKDFELKTSRTPTDNEIKDIELGWKLIKFVKSNGIIIVKDGMLIGVGAGQMSRVDAVEIAIRKSQFPLEGAVLLSDAFFPFADSVEIAAQHKITVMVEPGGSVRDNEVIEKAQEYGISLLFTGMRHFRH
ncbi:MAG: bifunctional phosphoribosylaminoimidazolecarboxamide formyltransferase/IMP cyclohydrolase [Candidatus Aminicenantes bacterium]|nr:bifunctional phosphoribosylaminoimidazolecarboxamide formyltransferase/IMP cyclohydrolase [Candidatus Aminicenantes bacterium]NIQ65193.1 bifunctional phosphoribosylaminoimidazolecarboxamide formyltransferase/IMP cyclohydrolase [Candidatus Aminicenantes bacterium]NIT21196.1 bifunctional phosphoribosylaminoimidazolecarboxamide formyltransferase/IMP cyclohydrolase [Candidatus Aminicenantes bacterium]